MDTIGIVAAKGLTHVGVGAGIRVRCLAFSHSSKGEYGHIEMIVAINRECSRDLARFVLER
jgi:hypothetical protein